MLPPRASSLHLVAVLGTLAALAPLSTRAQTADAPPSFDRPGLGVGTDIVPRGALAVELGLPSWERDRDREGLRSETLGTDATLRTGLTDTLEMQLALAPWQRLHVRAPGQPGSRVRGGGDSQLGVKWAPSLQGDDHWAVLATATLARGDADFSDGRQYALAATYERDLSDTLTAALFARHTRGAGERGTEWSPSLSLAFNERWTGFLEAGFTREHGGPSMSVAGGGVVWMPLPTLQFDASVDLGLNADSPDLQAGLGVSFYLR